MAKKTKTEQVSRQGYMKYMVPLLIVIATLIVYNAALDYDILNGWDDMEYLNDPDVQNQNLVKIFSNYHLGMYQPLSVSTLAINYDNAELNARPYHTTNLLLHIVNIFLLWLFLYSLSRKKFIAAIGAFLFALHPMNVEPVIWISARSTLLFTALYLVGLLTYLRYTEIKKPSLYALSLLFALLALFSKSLAMSFPFVLLIIDYFKGRTFNTRVWLEKAPFFVISVVFGIVAIKASSTFGHITELAHDYSIIDRFFILCHTYTFYLIKFIAPVQLSSIYAYPDMGQGGLSLLYYLSALVPLGLIYLVYRLWNKQREIVAGLLFFSIAVAPVLPLFWSRIFVAADRYAYFSSIGLIIVLAFLLLKLFQDDRFRLSFVKYVVWGVVVIYGGILLYLTHQQTKYWANAETLLSRAVYLGESSSNKALAFFYRGNIYQNTAEDKFYNGYRTNNKNMVLNSQAYYRMTIADYDSCINYSPEYMMAYANRGISYMSVSQYDSNYREKYTAIARLDFEKAISLDSSYADNYYNLAWVFWTQKDIQRACELWHKADKLGSVVAYQPLEKYCK